MYDNRYQVAFLGRLGDGESTLRAKLVDRIRDLGMSADSVVFLSEGEVPGRDRKAPFAGVFFGYRGASDTGHPHLATLLADATAILPCFDDQAPFEDQVPKSLAHLNGSKLVSNTDFDRLASAILENFRLLRAERRVFISYCRRESSRIALDLYDALDAKGFDVFLDTRDVPPGADFQETLWHRLCDCDVIVLLDTPDFRSRRWTLEELTRANATNIQILHVLWPSVAPDPTSAFSIYQTLDSSEFESAEEIGENATLKAQALASVADAVEPLRARALAARQRYLVDNLCDQARRAKATCLVNDSGLVSIELASGEKIAALANVGLPSTTRCQAFEATLASQADVYDRVWVVFDERGVMRSWMDHVIWLNGHLPVSTVEVSSCGSRIAGLTS